MTKYYVDTCIWRDYWENRQDNLRPLGEFALKFFNNLDSDDIVYYSNLTLEELSGEYSDEIISSILSVVGINLRFIRLENRHFSMASSIAKTGLLHRTDALHVAAARELEAKFVTRDKQILSCNLIDAHMPEELF